MQEDNGSLTFTQWLFGVTTAMLPMFFLPVTQDFYDTNKQMLLAVIAMFALIYWTFRSIQRATFRFSVSTVSISLLLLTVASVTGLFVSSVNKVEALMQPFGPFTLASLTILSFTSVVVFPGKTKRILLWILYAVGLLLGIITIYQAAGMGKLAAQTFPFLADSLWSPTGSIAASAALFTILLPGLVIHAIQAAKKQTEIHLTFLIIIILGCIAGLGIALWKCIPQLANTIMPNKDAWIITLEVLKNPKQAFFGVGIENFLAAFTQGRPASMNMESIWASRFTIHASLFLHVLTTYGITGVVAFVIMGRNMVARKFDSYTPGLWLGLASLLFLPPNLSLFIAIIILWLASDHTSKGLSVSIPHGSVVLRVLFGFVMSIGILAFIIPAIIAYRGELLWYQSLLFAKQNNGTSTYNTQNMVLLINPYPSRYHLTFSQTNMALAVSLAQTLKEDTTASGSADQQTKDRELITQLIQQSIREAKLAVTRNKFNILAWENMARIYVQLIDVARGADTWAVTTFRQAITLDPTNPALPVELGTLLVRMKAYETAIAEFQKSITLKPNYSNAYYNLANAQKLKGDTVSSLSTLKGVLPLMTPGTEDYRIVTNEIQSLENEKAPSLPSPTPPQPIPTIQPPLEL